MTGRLNVYMNNTSYLFQQKVKETQAVQYRWIKEFSSYKSILHIVTSIVYTFSTVLSKWRVHKKMACRTNRCHHYTLPTAYNAIKPKCVLTWRRGTERVKGELRKQRMSIDSLYLSLYFSLNLTKKFTENTCQAPNTFNHDWLCPRKEDWT